MIYEDYAIFTPGPVKMSEEILQVGAKQTPYFRNSEFSDVTFACEKGLLDMVNAPEGSKVIFLTASGTAGMEAAVMNLLTKDDNALVVNGGGFGQRFVDICATHSIPHTNFKVANTNLTYIENLAPDETYTALVVNAHETSVGHLYNLNSMGEYAIKNDMLYIVDAISMLVTDALDMQQSNIDVVIASSQKGLALPPGLTMLILAPNALKKVELRQISPADVIDVLHQVRRSVPRKDHEVLARAHLSTGPSWYELPAAVPPARCIGPVPTTHSPSIQELRRLLRHPYPGSFAPLPGLFGIWPRPRRTSTVRQVSPPVGPKSQQGTPRHSYRSISEATRGNTLPLRRTPPGSPRPGRD